MICPRPRFALLLAAMLTPAVLAQEKPPSPWAIDRALSVTPQSASVPALKYRLLPLSSELMEGNAVPIYLRLTHEQSDASRKYWTETPKQWNLLPLDKIPLDEVRKFFQDQRFGHFPRQIEIGARRRTAEWNYTLEEPNRIGLLLPDVQWMRNYAPMLVLQARVALAENDFRKAAHHLETGFAFSRHVAEGPTLIHRLVGIALAEQFAGVVTEWIERPDSPNLYWALAALPRPLIDLRPALEWEYLTVEKQIPDLGDLDRERTAGQWDAALRRVRTELRLLAGGEPDRQRFAEWFPKDCAPEDPAAKSPDLPAARKYVAQTRKLPPEMVEALPPAQVLLLYMSAIYQEDRDDWYRGSYLPYAQARPILDAAVKRVREAPVIEGHIPGRLLLPALYRVMSRQAQFERNLNALQVIEALRMYAAAHEGKLPDKLEEITAAPVPLDPGTGKPFEYSRTDDTVTLTGPTNEPAQIGRPAPNGVRYKVNIRKK
jgi:hypothetical protein